MNFLADEGVDKQVVEQLRKDGHQVQYIAEMDPGISDNQVLEIAHRESAILLTADKDFGELFYRQRRLAPGVILLRLEGLSQANKARIVASAVHEHISELLRAFTVITPGGIRIRQREIS